MNKGHAENCGFLVTGNLDQCWCDVRRKVKLLLITFAIFAVQIVGYLLSDSLALIADSGHVLSDSVAIFVVLCGGIIANLQFNRKKIESAVFWILVTLLIGLVFWIPYEAWHRFQNPQVVLPIPMILAAAIGGAGNWWQHIVNEGSADEHKHHGHKGLSAHIIADLRQSIGVVIAGLIILFTGWMLADPIISIVIALSIAKQVVVLLKEKRS